MKGFLIDNNLPDCLACWHSGNCLFVKALGPKSSDSELWNLARERDWVIVTKDSDFSHPIAVSEPPPKVIHVHVGNLRLRRFEVFMNANWDAVRVAIETHKLVTLRRDGMDCVP
jgi:predicted nuclease of predicted toxin-antitoxin system